jgi:tetratricopeptide (TPR) repeat protein
MSVTPSRALALALSLVAVAAAPVAADDGAAPARSRADVKTARAHFDKGRTLIRAGKYAEAIAELEAAYALDPRNEQLYNLGVAHHLNGQPAIAAEYYRKFLAVESTGKTAQNAQKYLDQIEAAAAARAEEDRQQAAAAAEAGRIEREREQRTQQLRTAEQRVERAEARVVQLEADLARARAARDERLQAAHVMRDLAGAAEAEVEQWRAVALRAPSGGGRGLRTAGTLLLSASGAALAAGAWYGQQANDLSEQVSNATAWTTRLDEMVAEGERAENRMLGTAISGGFGAVIGVLALAFGESSSTDRRDGGAVRRRIEAAP